MRKKILFSIAGFIAIILSINGQSWSFVGPYSNNNLTGSEFETGQMTQIVSDPSLPGYLFATSEYAGLWGSNDDGTTWTNIDMSVTGFDQARAIAFKNSSEIIVGNFHHTGDMLSYSTRVSAYNFMTQTWSNYPLLPASPRCQIKCVAVHPTNQSIIYAGTSVGLYRYDGTSWTLIVPNCYVEGIVFPDNVTCFISGSNMATASPNYYDPIGQSMVMVSTDPGNSIFSSFSPNITVSDPISHTEICKGPTSSDIFALTVGINGGTETRYLNKINKTGTIFTVSFLHSWSGAIMWMGGMARMPLIYDAHNNWLWSGGVYVSCKNLNPGGSFYTNVKATSNGRTTNGETHNDIHGFTINGNNQLYLATDGGIVKTTLWNLLPLAPTSVYFDRMNDGLNVCLINGFSGSQQDPDLYAIGGQDVVNTDIYDASIQRNRYTHYTWENDGAHIDKYNDNLMILDQSSYSSNYLISNDKGQNTNPASTLYYPNSTNFVPASSYNPEFEFGGQRVVQDPFRPGRIFMVGSKKPTAFFQLDFASQKFLTKAEWWFTMPGVPSHNWEEMVFDLSFSPLTKNSLHLITSNRDHFPIQSDPSYVLKYIGPDIDDCWLGHNQHLTPSSAPQWANISPNYANFSSLGTGLANITSLSDLGKVSFKKIETSPWNQDVVYVACNINNVMPNMAVKCLKYDGTNWSDYSNGIPADESVSRMVMDHWANDALYLATDKAVYYRDASMGSWIPYTTGLPTGFSTQMEVNFKENTVRVSKYGRGIWKSHLQCPSNTNLTITGAVPQGYFEADYISLSGAAAMTGGVTAYRAVNSVVLNPGFSATGSSTPFNTFMAYIHGCNGGSTSPYLYRSDSPFSPFQKHTEPEVEKEVIGIFPNPNKGSFTIEKSYIGNSEVEIYDAQGKRIRSFMLTEKKTEINLSGVPRGIYFVNIQINKEVLSKKIIVE